MQDWQFERAEQFNNEDLNFLKADSKVNIYELDDQTKNEWKEKLQPIYKHYEKKINNHYLEDLLQEINK